MPSVGFEPIIPASARQKAYDLGRAATGIGHYHTYNHENFNETAAEA
jgi:hypothetical protein